MSFLMKMTHIDYKFSYEYEIRNKGQITWSVTLMNFINLIYWNFLFNLFIFILIKFFIN